MSTDVDPVGTGRTARFHRRNLLVGGAALLLVGCGRSRPASPTQAPTSAPTSPARPPTSDPALTPAATASPPTPTASPPIPANQPLGFPLDPSMRTGRVLGAVGSRSISWGEGSTVLECSRDDQPSSDAVRANACGWNARTHLEYEGQPAVDWYVPPRTPVVATMSGIATLMVNTLSNPFDVYGTSREPYIGNPDRARAPLSPFPGPGGGQGVFVRIESDAFRADHAHFDLPASLGAVPAGAFLPGYAAGFDFAKAFGPLRDFRIATAVARWDVRRGQVIGFSGDSGYSEAPHLHYAISRRDAAANLCPTLEPGFDAADSSWLLRA